MKVTNVFKRTLASDKRIIINEGGTSSSKTYSILQLLYLTALRRDNLIISIVSESIPHLKLGVIRDFTAILQEDDQWIDDNYNRTDRIYTIGSSIIEFFSAEDTGKVHGPRRDILFVNELINIPYKTFENLDIRTREKVYADFNPCYEFYAHTKLMNDPDVDWIRSTYLDNTELPIEIKKRIESKRGKDANWWRVYGLGELGKIEGVVFTNWEIIDEFPEGLEPFYGLDFGYTNDPTALSKLAIKGDNLYVDELIYETGLLNRDIIRKFDVFGIRKKYDEIFADSAEPKSIAEIYRDGYNVKGVIKGKDSILNGIDILKRYNIKITKRSVNGIKELRNYRWIEDRDGNLTNKPIDEFNHLIDAMRYGVMMKKHRQKRQMIYRG